MRGMGKYQAERGSMSDRELDELAEWIDSRAIAEAILQELGDQGIEAIVANGQRVWLDFLESELTEGLRSTIRAIF